MRLSLLLLPRCPSSTTTPEVINNPIIIPNHLKRVFFDWLVAATIAFSVSFRRAPLLLSRRLSALNHHSHQPARPVAFLIASGGGGLDPSSSSNNNPAFFQPPRRSRSRMSMTSVTTISPDLLRKQNAETSTAIIEYFDKNVDFQKLAKYEGDLTVQRDKEDDDKLEHGIEIAKEKNVIDKNYQPEPYISIDVLGKTPEEVANIILQHVDDATKEDDDNLRGKGGGHGKVIVLVGLSGTGKGTTVARLRQILEKDRGEKVVTWSNGNIFRSVTLLAATYCEQQQNGVAIDDILTKENLELFMDMLSFGKNPTGKYDTHIHGLGLDLWVSAVQNTELKQPKVSKNIPTVAKVTQGEVILFAAKAVETMGKDGLVVLLEGREQTVNYVRTPHRFTLMLSDDTLIGKRRAAQRLMGAAMHTDDNMLQNEQQVEDALKKALAEMVKEIEC